MSIWDSNIRQTEREGRRRIFARLLLLVFVPMLVLSSMHTHGQSSAVVCDECAHHVSHPAHLSAAGHFMGSCLLCQFLSLTYVAAATLLLIPLLLATPCDEGRLVDGPIGARRISASRGPPSTCGAMDN